MSELRGDDIYSAGGDNNGGFAVVLGSGPSCPADCADSPDGYRVDWTDQDGNRVNGALCTQDDDFCSWPGEGVGIECNSGFWELTLDVSGTPTVYKASCASYPEGPPTGKDNWLLDTDGGDTLDEIRTP